MNVIFCEKISSHNYVATLIAERLVAVVRGGSPRLKKSKVRRTRSWQQKIKVLRKKKEAYNTCGSQVVTHPSTEQALHCLTSVI